MKGNDVKGAKDAKGSDNVCKQCQTCKVIGWLLPLVLLAIALVPNWLTSTWGKWVIVVIAVLYLIKHVKGCKKCMAM